MQEILILPLPGAEDVDVERVALEVEEQLQRAVVVGEARPSVDAAYDPARDQFNSQVLLQWLQALRPTQAERVLGITGLDLFIPVLTFVFGEAQLGGQAAVVSWSRLDNRYYGLRADARLLHERLVKEAIHELGHTYGLLHCLDTRCVMRRSTYVEQIDLKQRGFCMSCARSIQVAAADG
jgi:archaemetzincin